MHNRPELRSRLPRSLVGLAGSLGLHVGILVLALLFISRQQSGTIGSAHEISISLVPLPLSGSILAVQPRAKSQPQPEVPAANDAVDPDAAAKPDASTAPPKSAPAAVPDNSIQQPQSSETQSPAGNGEASGDISTLISMLLNQMRRCWIPPVEKSHSLTLSFRLSFNQDGSVASPPDLLAVVDDPYFRAAADATRRALYLCAPFNLPQSRYSEWAEISNFSFDPSEMAAN